MHHLLKLYSKSDTSYHTVQWSTDYILLCFLVSFLFYFLFPQPHYKFFVIERRDSCDCVFQLNMHDCLIIRYSGVLWTVINYKVINFFKEKENLSCPSCPLG